MVSAGGISGASSDPCQEGMSGGKMVGFTGIRVSSTASPIPGEFQEEEPPEVTISVSLSRSERLEIGTSSTLPTSHGVGPSPLRPKPIRESTRTMAVWISALESQEDDLPRTAHRNSRPVSPAVAILCPQDFMGSSTEEPGGRGLLGLPSPARLAMGPAAPSSADKPDAGAGSPLARFGDRSAEGKLKGGPW